MPPRGFILATGEQHPPGQSVPLTPLLDRGNSWPNWNGRVVSGAAIEHGKRLGGPVRKRLGLEDLGKLSSKLRRWAG